MWTWPLPYRPVVLNSLLCAGPVSLGLEPAAPGLEIALSQLLHLLFSERRTWFRAWYTAGAQEMPVKRTRASTP